MVCDRKRLRRADTRGEKTRSIHPSECKISFSFHRHYDNARVTIH